MVRSKCSCFLWCSKRGAQIENVKLFLEGQMSDFSSVG